MNGGAKLLGWTLSRRLSFFCSFHFIGKGIIPIAPHVRPEGILMWSMREMLMVTRVLYTWGHPHSTCWEPATKPYFLSWRSSDKTSAYDTNNAQLFSRYTFHSMCATARYMSTSLIIHVRPKSLAVSKRESHLLNTIPTHKDRMLRLVTSPSDSFLSSNCHIEGSMRQWWILFVFFTLGSSAW